jgi:hypothetical protein
MPLQNKLRMSQLAPSHRQRCQQPELANILLNETMVQQKIDAICIQVNAFQKTTK